jgi:hypothetical protein
MFLPLCINRAIAEEKVKPRARESIILCACLPLLLSGTGTAACARPAATSSSTSATTPASMPAATAASTSATAASTSATKPAVTPAAKLATAGKGPERVTVVKQSNLYLGPTTLYFGQDKAKLISREGNLIILCAPPDWQVVVFRRDDNRALVMPLDRWASEGFGLMRAKQSLEDGTASRIFDPVLKTSCIQIVTKPGGRFFEGNDPVIYRTTTKSTVTRVIFKLAASISLTEKMKHFVQGLYDQSTIQYLPLEMNNALSDGSNSRTFFTSAISKATVPPTFWTYPTHYTIAKTKSDIMASEKDVQKFGDILKTYMEDDTEPKHK